jgi:hypothetical protein
VGARYARGWSQAVGDLFKNGVGVWSRALLEHRNMIQIICRALIMGRDPVTEYRRFQASGATYFLDQPHVCP